MNVFVFHYSSQGHYFSVFCGPKTLSYWVRQHNELRILLFIHYVAAKNEILFRESASIHQYGSVGIYDIVMFTFFYKETNEIWIHPNMKKRTKLDMVGCLPFHYASRADAKNIIPQYISKNMPTVFCELFCYSDSVRYCEGILPKGLYLPCVSMAGWALLAGYHRFVSRIVCWPFNRAIVRL